LHSNSLIGRIPFVRVEANTKLEILVLQDNQLDFGIPNSISWLRSLEHLDVWGNLLGSTLPSSIGTMFRLKSLYLGDNNFIPGPFPSFLESAMNPLEELYLTGMRLTDTIPSTVARLSYLRYLELSLNDFVGTIPSEISSLHGLQYLLLRDKQLT
jgi:Leucine-rich repeat (LRR) protein